jgi:hypothetical protein
VALLVPDVGEDLALKALLNNTAGQDQTLKLFTNNITPSETDTAATYTEATGGGYAAKSLTGANWTFTPGAPSNATYNAAQTWTFTGPLTTNPTVFGYFVIQTTSGKLLWAEAKASFTPAVSGDNIVMTPVITAD